MDLWAEPTQQKRLLPQQQPIFAIGGIMRIRTVDLIDVSDAL